MKTLQKLMLVVLATTFFSTLTYAKEPVAMLTLAKGEVEYSKDGNKWKKVRRNKLLFPGYTVRTGAESSALVINQINNQARQLDSNSEINIAAEGATLIRGNMKEAGEAEGLLDGLKSRFQKAQRYTTVRRGVTDKNAAPSLKTARELVLTSDYSTVIWENLGSEYSYRLNINEQSFDIPAGQEGDFVEFEIKLDPGKHSYRVDLLQGDEVIYQQNRASTLVWLDERETKIVNDKLSTLTDMAPGDDFIAGYYLDQQGLIVPAMHHYQRYFEGDIDSNHLRPILIQAYHSLKLTQLRQKEAELYNKLMLEE